MIKYKLLRRDMTTHNGFQWEIGKTYKINVPGTEMCTNQVFHYYNSPEEAILFNPIHASIDDPILYEVECSPEVDSDELKGACKEMCLVKQIKLPVIELHTKVAFGILCALEVYQEKSFVEWAENWLSGKDRTRESAYDAAHFARVAAVAARTAHFARVAADAAADAARAADAAADAARAAAAVAVVAAADAARAAVVADCKKINFLEILEKAKKVKP